MHRHAVTVFCASLAVLSVSPRVLADAEYPPAAPKLSVSKLSVDYKAWIIAGAVFAGAGAGLVIAGAATTIAGKYGGDDSPYYQRLETDGLIVLGASVAAIIPGVILLSIGAKGKKKAAAKDRAADPGNRRWIAWSPVFSGGSDGGWIGVEGRF